MPKLSSVWTFALDLHNIFHNFYFKTNLRARTFEVAFFFNKQKCSLSFWSRHPTSLAAKDPNENLLEYLGAKKVFFLNRNITKSGKPSRR